jgi:heat shock protein HslJ
MLRPAAAVLAAALPLLSCSEGVTSPSDLEDGPWRLESMQVAGEPRFEPEDPDRFTAEFEPDGTIGVRADCNQCGGTYSVGDGTLRVTPMACTLIACPTPRGQEFAGLLQGTSVVGREGDRLAITSSRGTLVLRQ